MTTISFKLKNNEIVNRHSHFKSSIEEIDFVKYCLSNMIAMDETAVKMGDAHQSTIAQKRAVLAYIPLTGYKST